MSRNMYTYIVRGTHLKMEKYGPRISDALLQKQIYVWTSLRSLYGTGHSDIIAAGPLAREHRRRRPSHPRQPNRIALRFFERITAVAARIRVIVLLPSPGRSTRLAATSTCRLADKKKFAMRQEYQNRMEKSNFFV